jgi:nitrite reductase/ring-hydroxylating ferredoxin subunit
MINQEAIKRKEFLMKVGFGGSALMAVLQSCVYEHIVIPKAVVVQPNAPAVSADTVTDSPITITTESAGTVAVYKDNVLFETITVVVGINSYIPTTSGNFTFVLQTANGNSAQSNKVVVSPVTTNTPTAPTVSVNSTNINTAITINTNQAGTILVFNGSTQVASFQANKGANTYTPSTEGVYTFKLQTNTGLSGASVAVSVKVASATKDLLTLDLNSTANANLKTIGGYIRQNNIVVALISANTYAAVTQVCSHEGRKDVIYQNSEFYCTAHGARFTTAGVGENSRGSGGLTVYKTLLDSNILHVYA